MAIKLLNESDIESVQELLRQCQLPDQDFQIQCLQLFGLFKHSALIAVAGYEQYGSNALVRSVAVSDRYRGKGMASRLMLNLLEQAKTAGVNNIYLLTESASGFFARYGFIAYERNAVPARIAATAQFDSICADSAVCMWRQL